MTRRDWRALTFSSTDGIALSARLYGPARSPATPVLCLAGLTRNAKDFDVPARHLCASRLVIVPDYRGRGQSAHADWRSYTPQVELSDILGLVDALGLSSIDVIGTSRGGIIAMLMATARPTVMRRVVLNDIGPKIEVRGLRRIAGYVGRQPAADWATAIDDLARANPDFTGMSSDGWQAFARRLYRDVGGRPVLDYDPLLARTLPDPAALQNDDIPSLWEPFNALSTRPVLVIRGENSDLLTPSTVDQMLAASANVLTVGIPGRGHAPFLDEPLALGALISFLA